MKNITLEVREDGIGIAVMDMPGRPFNIFSEDMMADFDTLIAQATDQLQGLIITSGKSAFVAGADLTMIKDFANMRFDTDWQTMRDRFSHLGQMLRRLEKMPIPVVAAVNGLALGGGLELAMACHARVCVDVPTAILGLPEIVLGLLPGAGGTQRLPRYIGIEPALKMLFGGAPVSPAKAAELGLVDAVVPADELIEKALAMVKSVSAHAKWDDPSWSLPDKDQALLAHADWLDFCLKVGGWQHVQHHLYPAVAAIAGCVGGGAGLTIDEGCKVEWDIFVDLMSSPVAANMVVSCFLNKTAAAKWAQQQVAAEATLPATIAWCSEQPVPRRLEKKFELVAEQQAALVVIDQGQQSDKPCIILCNTANNDNFTDKGFSGTAQIAYAGDLKRVEAVEVTASDTLSKAVVDVAAVMGKIPVWSKTEGSVLVCVLSALRGFIEGSDKSAAQLAQAAKAVDADALFSLAVGQSSGQADNTEVSAGDRAAGLIMLAEVALTLWQQGYRNYQEVDVLALYGLEWPKWTGGPMAYLAMLQRQEVDVDLSSLSIALTVIEQPLKIKASYNTVL